ncbi:hypothetical protein SASPL_143520 [Salvia splendens]|uniref:Vesicle transport protein n=1 Tax=Salvia splendens TaxID=180675 RepID=A0A8X8WNI9_SALSN|nr:hypothetical protein SASPL_143520 [Salvia splendens]
MSAEVHTTPSQHMVAVAAENQAVGQRRIDTAAATPRNRVCGWLVAANLTAFLIGPKRQVTMMLDPVRIYATAIYIASIIIALFCAVYVRNKLLTLLAIVLEFGALIWYSASYIPFARAMVSKLMLACFDTEF